MRRLGALEEETVDEDGGRCLRVRISEGGLGTLKRIASEDVRFEVVEAGPGLLEDPEGEDPHVDPAELAGEAPEGDRDGP